MTAIIFFSRLRDIMLRNSDLPKDKSTFDQILNFFS